MISAVDKNLALLEQGLALLEELAAGDHAVGAVGPHYRHCMDFYDCFLGGLAARRIDYDARARSTMVETRPEVAIEEMRRIHAALGAVDPTLLDDAVDVRADTLPAEASATRSTVGRELLFLLSHTIHHYALIAILLRQEGFEVDPDFGFAPSTLEHSAGTR